jgi:enamine deaminase RidA (YjgF/YER057c/UK114 family)
MTKETRHVSHSDRSPGMKDQRPRYEQIKMIVEAGGGKMDDVVKVTVFVTDVRYREPYGEVRSQTSRSPTRSSRSRPSRCSTAVDQEGRSLRASGSVIAAAAIS